jgi:ubiquinone/menaquinone biosynthesis C-methylase UbiE
MFHPKGPSFFELARQALSSTQRGYDLLAPKFDFTPFRTPAVVLEMTARHLEATEPVGSALDVCCGTGAGMEMLRPICRDRVVGIDFSEPMLQVARQQVIKAAGSAQLEFVQADALEMPFSNEFDLAVCFGALGHIARRDESRFIEKVGLALKPGGRFVFPTSYLPPFASTRRWLARGFNAAMHIRNVVWRPPFVMFYLTFLLPQVELLLEEHGFDVQIEDGVFGAVCPEAKLVVATRR